MQYARFEQLVIGLGSIIILGTLALSFQGGGPGPVEIAAQLLLLGVLVIAVHWGRRGGMFAALVASLAYMAMLIPVLSAREGLTLNVLLVIAGRIVSYGLVGIVGGEICSRIKYVFARLDDSNTIDDWSRVYNQRYAVRAIEHARARYTRYGEPFSLVMITLSPALSADMSPSRQRTLVRAVAHHLRNDVRMVDEVCRLDDGRFCVLLPHTPREGGLIVNERVAKGVRHALGARVESVVTECLGAAEDTLAITMLSENLSIPEQPELAPA